MMRNAAGNAPTRQKKGAVLGILKSVFAERDPELVRELYQLATAQIEGFCPRRPRYWKRSWHALAYPDFPYEHHIRLRTNNVQERANRELKRRSRVVQVFPSRKSLIRMMGAVFSEMDEDGRAAAGSATTRSAGPSKAPRSTSPRTPTRAPRPSTPPGSSRSWSATTRFPAGRRRSMR